MSKKKTKKGLKELLKPRYCLLAVCLVVVLLFQHIDGWGEFYARNIYPHIAQTVAGLSGKTDMCLSDTFYFCCIGFVLVYPVIALWMLKRTVWQMFGILAEGVLWLCVWFYALWGLNYWQDSFYQRTHTAYVEYSPNTLGAYVSEYIYRLNDAYIQVDSISEEVVKQEIVKSYEGIAANVGLNQPFIPDPHMKTMLITPLASMVGVTGSMGPFFTEFTINGDVLPVDFPAIYAHELSHLYGITSEGEANFYAYLACLQSDVPEIYFSGLLSVFSHLMINVRNLMGESSYANLYKQVRPEIRQLVRYRQSYWMDRYSPLIGKIQDSIYDLYLRGHRVEGGRKNYSQVVALLMAWDKKTKRE